jgi:hypothetical protein
MVDIQGARFSGYGRCIYCGSTGKLKDEHIVPFSLGGKAVIEAASCGDCERITSYLDGYLARQIFHEYRAQAGMKSRRPKQRPTELSATIVKSDGTQEVRIFAPKEHPYFLVMPVFVISRQKGPIGSVKLDCAQNGRNGIRGGGGSITQLMAAPGNLDVIDHHKHVSRLDAHCGILHWRSPKALLIIASRKFKIVTPASKVSFRLETLGFLLVQRSRNLRDARNLIRIIASNNRRLNNQIKLLDLCRHRGRAPRLPPGRCARLSASSFIIIL